MYYKSNENWSFLRDIVKLHCVAVKPGFVQAMVDGIPVDISARKRPRTLRWPLAGSIQTCCGLLRGTDTGNPVSGCTRLWRLWESYRPARYITRGYETEMWS